MSHIGPSAPGDDRDRAVARAFGALLMAVGGVMAVACGLCSVVTIVVAASWGMIDLTVNLIALALGGVPAAVGLGLFVWGRALRRGKSSAPSQREDRG